jgi:hypothetical protein
MASRPARISLAAETWSNPSTATTPDSVSTRYALTNAPARLAGKRWIAGSAIDRP